MNIDNIDNNYINNINIYVQMFPKIEDDVIRLILEEVPEHKVLDILLNLSDEIDTTIVNDNIVNNIPELLPDTHETKYISGKKEGSPKNLPEKEPLIASRHDFLFDKSSNNEQNKSIFSTLNSLFRRKNNEKNNYYDPDDNL